MNPVKDCQSDYIAMSANYSKFLFNPISNRKMIMPYIYNSGLFNEPYKTISELYQLTFLF